MRSPITTNGEMDQRGTENTGVSAIALKKALIKNVALFLLILTTIRTKMSGFHCTST